MPLRLVVATFAFLFAQSVSGQTPEDSLPQATLVTPTPAEERRAGFEQRERLRQTSLVENVPLTNIGPTVMSGRVVDVDVNPDDPTEMLVAYASGGVWHTTNNGLSFEPIFDQQAVMTVGDIAVDWRRGVIWVGTGENNSSRSSYAGDGIYRSTDGGATWEHRGLAETHRTGRILLHPDQPNTLWVAASGHLYSSNPERGVFTSTDGGATWRKTLFVDDDTGAIDLVADPADPNVLYAAMWHRERRAWNFVESGEGSSMYKSMDGGETWALLSTEASGFPTGEGVGRIGLAVSPSEPNVVYALLDNQYRQPEDEEEDAPALTRDMLRTMTKAELLEAGEEALEEYLEINGFPAAYTAQSILEMIRTDELEPIALVEYLEDANRELFETPVIGPEVYRSDDGGQTWRRTHDQLIDGVYYSYGYYFGQIRVAPNTPDVIYILGVPVLKSTDAGVTFTSLDEPNVHVDHHALWINPRRPDHLVLGNDGGLNISYDGGVTWYKANTPPVGQFYTVQVDEAEPYKVYGGLQDNGVWMGAHTYEFDFGWYQEGDYPYDRLLGGDGMQVEVDTRTNASVYTGFQFGNYFRIDEAPGKAQRIQPRHELGERPLRFNWQTPIHLSRHNQDVLYLGSNKFHRSLNRGETWETLSEDLTKGGLPGDVPYGTLTSIDESPRRFGLIYAGSDDGLVHFSRDGGYTWTRISDTLPPDLWVSRVEASHHRLERVYVALNGYRWDHFDPYLYRSDDYGQSWTRLGYSPNANPDESLPAEPINVVLEDPDVEDILYVGTDHGLYVSIDGGQRFMAMMGGLPAVPVHDLKIQQREKHLVVGTHGRSIFVADVTELQQLTPEILAKPVHVFALAPPAYDEEWGDAYASWAEPDIPEMQIPYYADRAGTTTIRILTEDEQPLRTMTDEAERGLNYASYDLSIDPEAAERLIKRGQQEGQEDVLEPGDNGTFYLSEGVYIVEVTLDGASASQKLEVKTGRETDVSEPYPGPDGEDEIK